MASYVRQFFRAKRRKTDSSSEDSDIQFPRPTSSSGASTSSSAAFLSPSSTTNSLDFIIGTMTTTPPATSPSSTSSPSTSSAIVTINRNGHVATTGSAVAGGGSSGLGVASGGFGIGHRRQHSSPGHLQQYQQELHNRHAANIALIARRRRNTETEYDPNARPPKFKYRSPFYQSSGSLAHQDMRMLLIEAESRVLYDTATVIPLRNGAHPASRGLSPCGEFQLLRKKKDTSKLSQMIFGAVPNLKTNESFRIHVLEDEEMILVSKTFAIPKYRKGAAAAARSHLLDATSSDSDSQSTVKSLDGWRTRTSKSIMTTPEGFNRVRHISLTFGDDDTDSHLLFGSPGSSMSLPRAFSPPHRISKARRRQMAQTTSLSETSAVPIPSSLKARSRMSSMSSSQADDDGNHLVSMQNMRNVALGILVPIQQRCFLMQHIPLIESEMSRLETRIINAAGHPSTFLQNISKSWEELTEVICQLHNAPRLKHPYWLALNEKCHLDGNMLATEFCEQLAYLVRRYDRKEAGYFLSNLVTALLMHHMSWVASVASPPLVNMDKKQNHNMMFGMNSKEGLPTVGYNALMAQYLEISGACGNMRSAKLCILGDDVEILASVCAVLSFFIRCSAVQHIDSDKMWEVPTEQPFSPIDVSGSPNSLPGCSHHHQNLNNLNRPVDATSSRPLPLPNISTLSTSDATTPSGATVILNPSHPDETSSVAMMRRLRENIHGMDENVPSTSTAAALLDADVTIQTTEITVISSPHHHHHSVCVIDRVDFPCCPTIADAEDMWVPRPNSEGLGRSMFAGPLDNYCPHFVLSALLKNNANMPEVYSRMFDEVKCNDSACHRSSTTSTTIHHQSVSSTTSHSTSSICEPLNPENVLIVADIDQMTVKVLSSEGSDEVTSPSESVVAMLEQFVGMHDAVPTTTEFLVGIIEDSLAHIVGKSLTLVELVRSDQSKPTSSTGSPPPLQLTPDRVRTIIGCDHSDLRLIVNVAAVYWPPVLQSVLG